MSLHVTQVILNSPTLLRCLVTHPFFVSPQENLFFFFFPPPAVAGDHGPASVGNEMDDLKVLNRRVGGEKNLLHNLGLLCGLEKDTRSCNQAISPATK